MNLNFQTSCALAASLFYCGFSAIAGTTTAPAPATAKDIAKEMDEVNYVQTRQSGITLSGYVDAGYMYNFIGMGDTVNVNGMTDDSTPQGDFNLYATKIVLEKALTDENKLQAGFRVDIIMGEDAGDLGTNGGANLSDSFYLQQAFAQFRIPWGNGLEVDFGKWQAIIGYEAEERPANPNITSGIVSIIDPAWYIGPRLKYSLNDTVDLALGLGNGSGLSNGASPIDNTDEYAVTGSVSINAPGGNASTSVGFHYAPWGDAGYAAENEPVIILNWLGNWNPKFANDKLLLGFNTSFASFNDFGNPAPISNNDASNFFGVALYTKYQFTDIISLAGRAEYAHTDDNQLLGLPVPPPGGSGTNDIWTWTATLGFDLTENLLLRAEYRLDYGDDVRSSVGSGDTTNTAQMIATEVVFSF